jgi:hypothetical protein
MTQEDEAVLLACIQRATEDAWQDGRKRLRLKRVMEGRLSRMRRVTGFQTLEGLRVGDRTQYERFLEGCRRALARDSLIDSGQLGPDELRRLKEDFEARTIHDQFDGQFDAGGHWSDT